MSRLHDLAIQRYAEHYKRAYTTTDPRSLSRHKLGKMERTYAGLLRELPEGSRILDLGCGTGFMLFWLRQHPGIVPVGVDSCDGQIEIARKALPDIEVHCEGGLEFLRKNPEAFAGIFCTDVLEHLPEMDLCLEWAEAAWSALRPGGFFLCRTPNAANLTAAFGLYGNVTHYRAFTDLSLSETLEAAGFEDCRAVPDRPSRLLGHVQQGLERLVHRAVFLLCNRTYKGVFTTNVSVVGFKAKAASD